MCDLMLKESFLLSNHLRCDYAESWQTGFQDIGSPTMYGLIELHNNIFYFLIGVFVVVLWFFIRGISMNNKIIYSRHQHGHLIEFVWTITPALILGAIALPSFRLLYFMDEIIEPLVTVKAIGNQWYWSYEYTDYGEAIQFDSFMTDGPYRLLNVDNYMVLPTDTTIRLLITSSDVIHSFSVPSLGIKLDAIPGRLNSTGVILSRPGVFYGQCSELCGYMHAFMPIGIKSVPTSSYLTWLHSVLI